jgi:hypothetical protein
LTRTGRGLTIGAVLAWILFGGVVAERWDPLRMFSDSEPAAQRFGWGLFAYGVLVPMVVAIAGALLLSIGRWWWNG